MYAFNICSQDFAEHGSVVLGKTQKLHPLMKV